MSKRIAHSLTACALVGSFVPVILKSFNWWQTVIAVIVGAVGIELIERLVWDVLPGEKGK